MPESARFATMKIRLEFLAWLRIESARRGIFLYELVEELATQSLAGLRPWASPNTQRASGLGPRA